MFPQVDKVWWSSGLDNGEHVSPMERRLVRDGSRDLCRTPRHTHNSLYTHTFIKHTQAHTHQFIHSQVYNTHKGTHTHTPV